MLVELLESYRHFVPNQIAQKKGWRGVEKALKRVYINTVTSTCAGVKRVLWAEGQGRECLSTVGGPRSASAILTHSAVLVRENLITVQLLKAFLCYQQYELQRDFHVLWFGS